MYQYQPPQYPEPVKGGMTSGQRTALLTLCLVLALAIGFVGGIAVTRAMFNSSGCAAASSGLTTAAVPPDIATNTPVANGPRPTSTNAVAPTPVTPGAPQPTGTPLPPLTDNSIPKSGDQSLDQQMTTFWTAWKLVEQEYYGRPVDRQKMVYGATKGMMDALGDPHTSFDDPQQTDVIATDLKGQFGGIGVYIDARNDKALTIQAPIPDTPASRAGLMAGDVIIKVDGKDITQLPQNVVIPMIKGPAGTKVTLTIVRGSQPPFDVTLTREVIVVPSATGKMLANNILYIQVTIFGDNTVQQLDQVLSDNLSKHPKSIILDLRNNGGGYVVAAQQLLGRFLSDGKVIMYQKYSADAPVGQNPLTDMGGSVGDTSTPMVVLVNGGTASASEITSGALQDYKRATIIGEKTYGKGSEQNVRPLPDGSSVRITIAHWLTPNNREIDGVGLTPDIQVTMTADDIKAQKDPQLDRAVQFLTTGK
jgi:carboxyl-terminal processing protease